MRTNERKTCFGVSPFRPVSGFFSPRRRSAPIFSIIIKEVGDSLQYRLHGHALLLKLQVGKTRLPIHRPHSHFPRFFDDFTLARFNAWTYRGAASNSISCTARPLSKQRCISGTRSSGT